MNECPWHGFLGPGTDPTLNIGGLYKIVDHPLYLKGVSAHETRARAKRVRPKKKESGLEMTVSRAHEEYLVIIVTSYL